MKFEIRVLNSSLFFDCVLGCTKSIEPFKKNLDIPSETLYGFYTPKESLLKDQKNGLHEEPSSFTHICIELKEEAY